MEQLYKGICRSPFAGRVESTLIRDSGASEIRLQEKWRSHFPQFYAFCLKQGQYHIPDREWLLRVLEGGFALTGERNNCILRVDCAIAHLWPLVAAGDTSSVFPSRWAAAVTSLDLAEACKASQDGLAGALRGELLQALEDLEQVLRLEQDAEA